jgi:hypothetical protein
MAHGTGVLATIVAPHAARLRVRPAVAAAARRRARAAANRRVRASAGASAAATAARHKTAALPTPDCRVDLVIRGRRAIDALPVMTTRVPPVIGPPAGTRVNMRCR